VELALLRVDLLDADGQGRDPRDAHASLSSVR
jgi:hypothetical protein